MGLATTPQTLRMISFLIVACLLTLPVQAQYSGGSGTADDPYQIATAEDLVALGETPSDYDKHFMLTDDIDLDPNIPGRWVFDKAVIAPDANDTEDAFEITPFTGALDGNGHTISNLTIIGRGFLGLFGETGSGASISNLGLEAVEVHGTGDIVGALVGLNRGSITSSYSTGTVSGAGWDTGGLVSTNVGGITASYSSCSVNGDLGVGGLVGCNFYGVFESYNFYGTIDSSHSTGSVSGKRQVGGLVGYNEGHINTCYSTSIVSGTIWGASVGGLVGENFQGSIFSSYSTGMVNGDSAIGGLVGHSQGGSIIWSFSSGSVSGTRRKVGGLVGSNDWGLIATSYSTGSVSGREAVGGLVGVASGSCRIVSSYSKGAVRGSSEVGGLVGTNSGRSRIYSSYSSGTLAGMSDVGGLVGRHSIWDPNDDEDRIRSSFWDVQASGQTTSAAGDGKTTAEMKDIRTFVDAGWDFETVWKMTPAEYPRLERRGPGTPVSGEWFRLSPMKMARDQFAGAMIGDEIFVFGGNAMGGKNLYSGEKYSIATDTWSDIADNPHYQHPFELWLGHGVEEVSGIGFDGRFYVFGAYGGYEDPNGEHGVFNYNQMYNPATNTWTALARKPTTASAAIPVLYEGEIYLFGGYEGDSFTRRTAVEAYNSGQDIWRCLKDMPRSPIGSAIAVHDHYAYVIAGYDEKAGAMSNEVMRYDFQADTWERDYCAAPPDAARVYSYATQTPVINGKAYLIGGGQGTSENNWSVDTFTVFDIESKTWEPGPALPAAREGHLTVTSDDSIYVIGGQNSARRGEIEFDNAKDTVFALKLSGSLWPNALWDSVDETDNDTDDMWRIPEGQDYAGRWREHQN